MAGTLKSYEAEERNSKKRIRSAEFLLFAQSHELEQLERQLAELPRRIKALQGKVAAGREKLAKYERFHKKQFGDPRQKEVLKMKEQLERLKRDLRRLES